MGKTGAIRIDSVVGEAPGSHARSRRGLVWTGRVLSALPVLLMTMSGVMKLSHGPEVVQGFVGKYGYLEQSLLPIGVAELACVVLYLFPRTAVLGAVLMTGYLGGAVATHARVGEVAFLTPAALGAIAWLGLWLRDARLRALLPLRGPVSE